MDQVAGGQVDFSINREPKFEQKVEYELDF